jgi:hypothetical protein
VCAHPADASRTNLASALSLISKPLTLLLFTYPGEDDVIGQHVVHIVVRVHVHLDVPHHAGEIAVCAAAAAHLHALHRVQVAPPATHTAFCETELPTTHPRELASAGCWVLVRQPKDGHVYRGGSEVLTPRKREMCVRRSQNVLLIGCCQADDSGWASLGCGELLSFLVSPPLSSTYGKW